MQQRWRGSWVVAGCLFLTACAGGADEAGGAGAGGASGIFGGGGFGGAGGVSGLGGTGGTGGTAGVGGGDFDAGLPPLPPEMELSADFELPRAGERFVYAANPTGDTVAVIDGDTLRITTIEAGDQPTFLQTLAGSDNAIVLNVGSDDATVIRATETGISRTTVRVVPGANAISVAPDGKHAVVYYNSAYTNAGGSSGSFQDVTVISIDDEGDVGVSLTVGFRPSAIFHQADSARSFVVTEDGVSILDYAVIDTVGAGIAPTVPLRMASNAEALDVSVTANGLHALARTTDGSHLRLANLGTREIASLELTHALLPTGTPGDQDAGVDPDADDPLVVTDLDLSPTGDMAFAVVRDRSVVLALPIPAAFVDPSAITVIEVPGQVIGSIAVADDGQRALLFTTAYDLAESVTVLNLVDFTVDPQTIALRKAVKAIAIAADGKTALIVHKKADGDPTEPGLDPDLAIDRSYGYSVVSLDSLFAKLQVTESEVGPFTIVPDSSHLFLLFNAGTARTVQRVNLRSFLVDSVALGSRPVSIGSVAAAHKVFVSQEHPDGRITFIDWLAPMIAGATESITGFELNSRIRE